MSSRACHFTLVAILFCATHPAYAESEEEKASRKVMTNVAREGYEQALLRWQLPTLRINVVSLWSQRLLDAEGGVVGIEKLPVPAIKGYLKRAERLRRGANVQDHLEAATADFDYQRARSLLAHNDPNAKQAWSGAILELSRLQGTWREDLQHRRAQGLYVEKQPIKVTIVGGVAELVTGRGHTRGFVTLDPTQDPKTIDIAGMNSDYRAEIHGIYELNGDQFRLAWIGSAMDGQRPHDFVIENAKDYGVYTLKRYKSKQVDDRQ